ncbi:hypothetical protein DM02DRAFT_636705 [Periconia macrospinosa]|uniref:Uncharacterized protein n=1 Tax=Periconia macrospinosa TaxID=97972 RepID=A0A2V1CXY4_9PLEO|nr:hypothetical protein DM02DRAFT_636705 [Periconia macrospinosa]
MSEHMQGEGGGTGQTLREVLEELYGQSSGNSASRGTLQETSERARQEKILRPAQEASEEASQQGSKVTKPTDRHRPRRYQQKTIITGINPMDMPGVAARIAQVHERVLMADGRHAGRKHILGPRSVDVYRSGPYWQKTEISGKDSQDMSEDATHRAQEDEPIDPSRNVNQILAVSAPVSGPGNSVRTAQENREAVFYRALGGMERTRLFDSSNLSDEQNQLRTRIGMRTLTDIFKSSQKEYREKSAREESSGKRARPRIDVQPSEGGMEEQSQKRARRASPSAERNASRGEEVAAIMRALEEEFEEKERQSHGRLWCDPIPHERKVATVHVANSDLYNLLS